MPVDRCVCHSVPFSYLVERNRREGISLEQLSDETNCCTGCGMCEPYLRLAIATGMTAIPPMPPRELEARIAEATQTPAPPTPPTPEP